MSSLTNDKYLDFVIDHASDIPALIELWDDARARLPQWVDREVSATILEMATGYFVKHALVCEADGDQVWWFDPANYDPDLNVGVYFCYEFTRWTRDILLGTAASDGAFLCAYVEPPKSSKARARGYTQEWRDRFSGHATELAASRILVLPKIKQDQGYLAAYYLRAEINLPALRTPGAVRRGVEAAVERFTDAMLPILKS